MNFKERDMNIFPFVRYLPSTVHWHWVRPDTLWNKCRYMAGISRFLMFHCWSSQHCWLLISYFLFYFVCVCVCERTTKKNKRRIIMHIGNYIDELLEKAVVSDEDVCLYYFHFRVKDRLESHPTTLDQTNDKCIKYFMWNDKKTTIKRILSQISFKQFNRVM